MADEKTDNGLLIAEALTSIRADLRRQNVSLYVLRNAVASLLNPSDPKSAEKRLEEIEAQFASHESRLQDTRELLALIRKVKGKAQ